jgi:hypothetical protein
MSTVVRPSMEFEWDRVQRAALWTALGGAVAFVVAGLLLVFFDDLNAPRQFFISYLVAYQFWLSIALGSLVVLMIQYLTGGRWGLVLRRVLESGTRTLGLLAVLFVPILFGLSSMYLWSQPDVVAQDEDLLHKQPYLNVPFFIARAVGMFVIWLVFTYLLSRWSQAEDRAPPGPRVLPACFRTLSAPGLVLYGLTVTLASIDWVMSLEPHWYSTIFPVLFVAGQLLTAFTFAIIVLILLRHVPPLSEVVTKELMRDLGGLLFMFVMFWAYMSFSQLLLVWMDDLPEELPWYLRRSRFGWEWVAVLLLVLHFIVPIVLLLFRDVKENARVLLGVAGTLLVMRFIDLFFWIEPAYPHASAAYWLLDVAALAAVGGLWLWWFVRQLRGRPLMPLHEEIDE